MTKSSASRTALARTMRKWRGAAWRHMVLLGTMLLSISILLVVLLAWDAPYGSRLLLQPGEVASFNVVAPRRIVYESRVQLERVQERAAQAVPDQYDVEEAAVRRAQINRAREVLELITAVRADGEATLAEKTDRLLEIEDLDLTAEVAVGILSLSDDEWQAVVRETPLALDRVMRDEIRESNLPLIARRVPMVISANLSQPATEVAIPLVQHLIRPNSTLNAALTAEMRAAARASVPPQIARLEPGEVIVRAGDVATAEKAEALEQVSVLQHEWDFNAVLRAALFSLALLAVAIGALYRLTPWILRSPSQLALLLIVTVAWLLAAKFMVVNHPWVPYLYPLAALAILVSVLCDQRVAYVMVLAFGLVLSYLSLGSALLTTYVVLGALAGMQVVGRGERLNSFLWAALAIAAVNMVVLGAFWLPFAEAGAPATADALLLALLNGTLSAAIALIGYFVLGNVFDVTTPLQLTELSRPTHPLLRQLLLKASGTYHHTILVSNMAERAAAAIGADALLVRVGAYYHDIGKTVRPYFFAENIMDETSPHEKLDPLTSAQIIISHVKDGLDLAQKYHLPLPIQDFIREHHGRSLVKYFYIQAQRQAQPDEHVSEEDFRYPGPNPRSKETSILLLADTCEAAVRAVRPGTREELEALVDRLIDERMMSGELDESELTFVDLQKVRSVFLQVLQGVHHPRIVYPEPAKSELPSAAQMEPPPADAVPADGAPRNGSSRPLPGGIEEPALRRPNEAMNLAAEG
jgi:putative nucleotidyltransferase with HDIG domain